MQACSNWLSWEGIGTQGHSFVGDRRGDGRQVCKWRGRQLRTFIPDGLCFFSKVGADEICREEALGQHLKVSNS